MKNMHLKFIKKLSFVILLMAASSGCVWAQTCIPWTLDVKIAQSSLPKYGYNAYIDTHLPLRRIYHNQITTVTNAYHDSAAGNYGYPLSSGYTSGGVSDGSWSSDCDSGENISLLENINPFTNVKSNYCSGSFNETCNGTDGRGYYAYNSAGGTGFEQKSYEDHCQVNGNIQSNIDVGGDIGGWGYAITKIDNGHSDKDVWDNMMKVMCYPPDGYFNITNCFTNGVCLSAPNFWCAPYEPGFNFNTILDPIDTEDEEFNDWDDYDGANNPVWAGSGYAHDIKLQHLDLEYTDDELRTNIMSLMPAYPAGWSSNAMGAAAYSTIDDPHWYGTGQNVKYRFELPLTETNVTYKISWDIIQQCINAVTNSTSVLSNQFKYVAGTGDPNKPAPSEEQEILMPPFYCNNDTGGCCTEFVANVTVTIVTGGDPGSGPGMPPGSPGSPCGRCAVNPPGHDGAMQAEFGLGRSAFGQPAGSMRIWAGTPSQALATPASLNFMGDSSVVVLVTNNNHLAQVYAPQTLANIVAFDAYDYEICFYHAAQVGAPVDGIYPTNGLTPYVTWLVQNPNTTNDDNTIMLTETRGASSWVYTYIYNPVINSWTYISPGGVSQTQYITTSNPDGSRVLTQIIGGTNGSVAQVFSRTYQTFSWGEGVVSETVGTGASAKTTTKTYYDNIPPNGSFVPLEGVVNSDGSWTYYCPLPSSDGTYLPYCESSSIGNSSRLLFYDYTPLGSDDGTQEPRTARTVIEQVNGQESSRAYLILLPGERHDIRCVRPYANWSDSDNLVTVTKYYTSGPNIFRVQSVANPDGTMAFYDYASSTNGWQTNTVSTGQPNSRGTVIADGTQTTTILDSFGQTVLVTVRDLASGGTILRQDAYGNFDALDRAQLVTHLDGTTETFDYDCCHLAGSVDRDGVATGYLYDAAKRNYGYAKFYDSTNPITYQNVLDAADRVVQSQRIGSDGSMITLSQSGYDTAGRLVAQTNALGGVTTYVESNDPATGGLIRTTTYPDLGTRIDSYYADGSLKSVAGTAVHPVRYEYGAGSDDNGNSCTYTKEVKQNNDLSDSSEWTQTYTDMAGRSTETLYAGDGHYDFSLGQYFSGPSSRSFYNSKGQLWKQVDPDGVATLYQYNAKGELAYTAVDMDQNDTIDFGGADRITWTTNDVTTDHGTAVSRSQTFVWATTGVNHASPVSVSETSVNGQNSWQTKYGDANTTVTSQSQISYSSPSRSVTTIAPDGTYTINTFSYGRLISSTRYDSGHAQIGSTTYAYDAHGRQHQVTDARNGTTTYGYNSADQVNSVTTPKPGSGQSAETTTTAYDQMLRPFSVTQPDGAVVNSVYLLTGELGLQSGSRTYPVAYGYDYAGRMQTMTNWSSFNSLDGARGTTWNYDSRRGFLASKAYADGNGPAYIYTPGGRLQTRTWVRTDANGTPISTTYAYDPAGSLTNVSYSDATPVVSYAYDRLGRQSTVAWSNITETLTYNLANELLGEAYSGGALNGLSVTNGYDSYLRRATLAARSGSTALAAANYGYDNASRLSTVSDANGDTVTNIYLANSPLVGQIAFNQGSSTRMTTTKQYDSLNRLTQVSSQPSASGLMPIAFNYNYNPANQRTKNTLADGSYWIYGYDALGQVTNACKFWRDGTAVAGQQFDYAFDTIGNRTQTKAGGDATGQNLRVANYSANNLNQIISRDVPALVDVLGVSLVTNTVTVNGQPAYRKAEYFRQQLAADNSASSLWFNLIVAATGQTSVTGSVYVAQSPEQFSYDPDGNLTNDGRWAYTWDAENRLVTMTVTPNVGPQYQLAFAYDPKGRRIQKTVATNGVAVSTNKFLYDGWNLVAELQPNNAPIRSYVWGNDLSGSQQGAGGVGGLLEVSCYGTTTTNCFPAFDGNGNVAALINAADGTIVANYEYAAFGEPIRVTGAMARNNPFRFSTKYSDDESDLLYYGHRYYRPSTGSWINRDQIEEKGGLNIFGFTKNNPIINYDINGNITVKRLTPDPIADNCGGYDVYFEFTLEHAPDKDGYIVQKVTYTANWTVGFPNPAIPTESHSLNKTYWEAWFVKAGQTTVTTAKLGYTDHAGDWARPSSYGTSTSSGEIKFFYTETTKDLGDPGATPPKAPSPSTGWSEDPNNTTWWGMLPHTGDPDGTPVPTWWNNSPDNGEPAASRSVTANWKCTCARVSIQTDGKVSASP